MKMKKILIAIFVISLVPNISFAGPKAEVLHWWTSGGEAGRYGQRRAKK